MNNKYIREKFDGLTSEIHNWDLMKTSAIFKPEYKKGNIELTYSYLNSAKCLYNNLVENNHPIKGITVIITNSLVIPFLFLCRHTIELAVKTKLDNMKIGYGNTHNLKILFSKLDNTANLTEEWQELMNTLELVDDKGMWLRFDKDLKTKKEYINKSYFINSTEIIKKTEELTKYLLNFNN